ncbi:hypothetical protein FA13DRAFT_1757914 [Coprinellus micaceus]|uniref:Uncharacterized protein n=1 Tax=Coprinellus micaceus TaxID=71717 RepID=A0A4Y7SEQ3_COPMI|nr:hypothetical protein FA13DRAFT_1757914 [Coprinellus micaceus]
MPPPPRLSASLLDRLEVVPVDRQGLHGQSGDLRPLLDRCLPSRQGLNLPTASRRSSSKRPRLYSRHSERGLPTRLSPLESSSPWPPERRDSNICAPRLSRNTNCVGELSDMEIVSSKPPLIERIDLGAMERTLSSRISSPMCEDSFDDVQPAPIAAEMMLPQPGTNIRNWKDTSYLGPSGKTKPLSPQLTPNVSRHATPSVSWHETITTLSPSLGTPSSLRSASRNPNGPTSSSLLYTKSILFGRALDAWEQLRSPLRSLSQQNISKRHPNGHPPGTLPSERTSSSSHTGSLSSTGMANTSRTCSLPDTSTPTTKSSPLIELSEISSVVDSNIRDCSTPSSRQTESKLVPAPPKEMQKGSLGRGGKCHPVGVPFPRGTVSTLTSVGSVTWTTIAKPLPSPPPSVLQDPENPHLFCIVTPQLLVTHPNRPFVFSVVCSLREGFWPYANIPDHYPYTVDESNPTPSDPKRAQFLRDQRRYSNGFHGLLPGMYAMPLHAVPKDGDFSLNSMVDKNWVGKVPLDGMKVFGEDMIVAWKSDVSEAYHLIPMHPRWQIKQVEIIDLISYLNRCNVFGGTGSQADFISFMACVLWIAINVYHIDFISEYSDDHPGLAVEGDEMWYEPYKKDMPTPQVRLLLLWDELGIPHSEKKQIWGSPLVIIGILVDPNEMTMTLPNEARRDLLVEMERWADEKGKLARRGATLQTWQQFAGWMNWAFNVYPLVKPCLSNVYAKMKGRTPHPTKKNSPGIKLLQHTHWDPSDATYVIYCDASLYGMGFYAETACMGFYGDTIDTGDEEFIFFHEAICILAAMRWLNEHESLPQDVVFYCDNTNTVDIFNTLSAKPRVNPILKEFIDIIIPPHHDFKVIWIPTTRNTVADALSHFDVDKACRLVPGLHVNTFEPPRVTLGPKV